MYVHAHRTIARDDERKTRSRLYGTTVHYSRRRPRDHAWRVQGEADGKGSASIVVAASGLRIGVMDGSNQPIGSQLQWLNWWGD